MEKQPPKIVYPVILILFSGLIFRSIIALYLYPGFDEAYYYLYTKYLDWSYFDHPIFVALTTGLGVWLTGEVNQFTIRLGSLLLYTVSLYLLYLISKKLFDRSSALLTLVIASIIPIFQLAFGVLTLPDVPLIFFWSLTLLCTVNEFFSSKSDYIPSYRLAMLGILVGLACLSKYHGFILGLAILGFCATTQKYRSALSSLWLWLGVALFIVTLFPLWWWNLQHDWASFRFQLSGRFQPDPNVLISSPKVYNPLDVFVVFLGGIGYLFPTMGLPLWWVSWRALSNQFSPGDADWKPKQLLILWLSLPLTLGFTLLGGLIPILPTWPMPGFWGLSLILGYYASSWQKLSPRWVKRWLWGSGLIIYPIFLVLLLHLTTGLLQKPNQYPFFNGLISHHDDPSTELIDIIQLRQGLKSSPTFREALADSEFIFTNAYYLGGSLSMAIAPLSNLPIICFSSDRRGFTFWTSTEELVGKDGLYITLKRFIDLPKLNQEFSSYFVSFSEIAQIPLQRGGEITDIFYVYQGKKLLKPYRSNQENGDRQIKTDEIKYSVDVFSFAIKELSYLYIYHSLRLI